MQKEKVNDFVNKLFQVQSGFGRTGEHFWGFEGHGVVPDMVTMAKGMGNGFPLAAVVTTPAIAQTMSHALHFNTFGGNPMASAVGLSVLEVGGLIGYQCACNSCLLWCHNFLVESVS